MATENIHDAYTAAVITLRHAGDILRPALEARYEAPPQGPVRLSGEGSAAGVSNPTLDVVLDPRRMAVSDGVREVERALRRVTSELSASVAHLNDALAAWEGHPTD